MIILYGDPSRHRVVDQYVVFTRPNLVVFGSFVELKPQLLY